MEPRVNRVYRAINRPLTIWGVERGLFFLALMTGVGLFNFFGNLLDGVIGFVALWALAAWTTKNDPQMLRILLNSSRTRSRYDAVKFEPPRIRVVSHV